MDEDETLSEVEWIIHVIAWANSRNHGMKICASMHTQTSLTDVRFSLMISIELMSIPDVTTVIKKWIKGVPLNLSGMRLHKVPSIPDDVTELILDENFLTSIANDELPKKLQILKCSGNKLTELSVPSSVKILICNRNKLTKMPKLPANLAQFSCKYNRIEVFSEFPKTLKKLVCSANKAKILKDLPIGLLEVDCSFNMLTELKIPYTTTFVNCEYNQLSSPPVVSKGTELVYEPQISTFKFQPLREMTPIEKSKFKFRGLALKNIPLYAEPFGDYYKVLPIFPLETKIALKCKLPPLLFIISEWIKIAPKGMILYNGVVMYRLVFERSFRATTIYDLCGASIPSTIDDSTLLSLVEKDIAVRAPPVRVPEIASQIHLKDAGFAQELIPSALANFVNENSDVSLTAFSRLGKNEHYIVLSEADDYRPLSNVKVVPLENRETRFSVFAVMLLFKNNTSHMMLGVVDVEGKKVMVIDPIFANSDYAISCSKALVETAFKGYSYDDDFPIVCPKFFVQQHERTEGKIMSRYPGYCVMWTLWMIETLFKNPHVPLQDLYHLAMAAAVAKYGSLRLFIELYATRIERLMEL